MPESSDTGFGLVEILRALARTNENPENMYKVLRETPNIRPQVPVMRGALVPPPPAPPWVSGAHNLISGTPIATLPNQIVDLERDAGSRIPVNLAPEYVALPRSTSSAEDSYASDSSMGSDDESEDSTEFRKRAIRDLTNFGRPWPRASYAPVVEQSSSGLQSHLLPINLLSAAQSQAERDELRRKIDSQVSDGFSERDFDKRSRVRFLYSLRYKKEGLSPPSLKELASLCDELRAVLFEAMFTKESHAKPQMVASLAALIEDRILCCTGDPGLRLDACWDRRPRGTMLDFRWTLNSPAMPDRLAFIAHFTSITLTSILIQTMEAVKAKAAT
ncbi:hypothetical protein DL95DRAFT_500436 [Leptodontidium sp. 2 PMI_412]|nr:hypothetical protein DL95DRAFT_500436 [Leptodontidium sp. 2 PMI_412]